jgi:hypothetical protein
MSNEEKKLPIVSEVTEEIWDILENKLKKYKGLLEPVAMRLTEIPEHERRILACKADCPHTHVINAFRQKKSKSTIRELAEAFSTYDENKVARLLISFSAWLEKQESQ